MIGIFDSGFGGLVIFKEILTHLPNLHYLYLGDSARAPYGEHSSDTIYQYTKEAVDFLFNKGCCLIILACNTASSQALRKIQQEYLPQKNPNRRVLGVIKPIIEIVSQDKINKIGVIGTRATIASGAYEKEFIKIKPDLKIFSVAAPLLVPLIEEGWINKPETDMILQRYLKPLKMKKIEALILACTHYPIIINKFKKNLPDVKIYNIGKIVANSLMLYLERHPEFKVYKQSKKIEFFTTDNVEKFQKFGKKIMKMNLNNVKKISL